MYHWKVLALPTPLIPALLTSHLREKRDERHVGGGAHGGHR
jgi:hypothetical protein